MSSPRLSKFARILPVLLGLLLLTVSAVRADDAAPAKPPVITVPAGAGATPGQKFDPAAATRAWLDSMPADKRAKSDAYFEGTYWLLLWKFPARQRHRPATAHHPDIRADPRFRGTDDPIQGDASGPLRHPVHPADGPFELPAQRLRGIFPAAPIRARHPDFLALVRRTTDWAGRLARCVQRAFRGALRRVPARPANLVALGHGRVDRLFRHWHHAGAALRRTAFQ